MISVPDVKSTTIAALLLTGLCLSPAAAADVTFTNTVGMPINLHLRVGSIGSEPDTRGSANISLDSGTAHVENVGDGDVWFAYGPQVIGGDENPVLCHATGGEAVVLSENTPTAANGESCFATP